ncbi:aminotransferase class I/II-fold pyridoxal phosphate-dependent enzyme [Nocardia sp. NPDC051929]|uniref:aminotransferase class I/II-fold pyridoxal phosphate-dependent enzyme n=1 Tax=Nocardia sp. NPDC051929 TaxID=3364327 RepID=UPI0037C6E177
MPVVGYKPVEKAIILAAGSGRRIGGGVPKSLTQVGGRPILHRVLEQLASAGVRETVLVVGHRSNRIRTSIGSRFADMDVVYVPVDRYDSTNNAYSLWMARHHLDQDIFVLDGDVVFDSDLLVRLAAASDDAASGVSALRPGMNGTVADVDASGRIVEFLSTHDRIDVPRTARKTVNVHVLRAKYLREEFVPLLEELVTAGGCNEFYEQVLALTVRRGNYTVRAVDCTDIRWYEVDDVSDVIAADYVFSARADRLPFLEGLHGGYWRFDIADHRLMINPYFPPGELIQQLADDLTQSLTAYPLGSAALQRLLAAVVGVPAEHLVVANGASELITALGRILEDVALVVPGFNEYEAAFARTRGHHIELAPPEFRFDSRRCVEQATRTQAKAVVVTSPNNPTSIAVPREDLLLACKLLADQNMRLIVDESFVDFHSADSSVLDELSTHPNLTVIKSMSKAYGVGGLRLGFLATADTVLRERVLAELPVWNINGLAEAFLRRLPGFADQYQASIARVRHDRAEFYRELRTVPGVTALEPDANFVLLRLLGTRTAREVTEELLHRHGVLVKDCTNKSMPDAHRYIRIACRTAAENTRVIAALTAVLSTAE